MSKSKSRRTRRVVSYSNANLRLPGPALVVSFGVPDRRFYHPLGKRAPLGVTLGSAANIVSRPVRRSIRVSSTARRARSRSSVRYVSPYTSRNSFITPSTIAFEAPSRVVLCVRRSVRKEVMFASGKAGRRGQRPPRRNQFSDISCRR